MGLGVSINPIAFLVVQDKNVKLLPVNHSSTIDKLLDYVPDVLEKANKFIEERSKCEEIEQKCDENIKFRVKKFKTKSSES